MMKTNEMARGRGMKIEWLLGALGVTIVAALACGGSEGDPAPDPAQCVAGETMVAPDGCNTCQCDVDGNWNCTKIACPDPQAGPGESCSLHGMQCEEGLVCEYQCPGNQDPDNCNYGINPSGVCVEAPAAAGEPCSLYGTQCEEGLSCHYQCPGNQDPDNCNYGINPSGVCAPDTAECVTDADCVSAGCSGQLCVSAAQGGLVTTCEYRDEYACYHAPTTSCGCQSDFTCGWAQTTALSACLSNATGSN